MGITIKTFCKLLRVNQYIKNLFIFMPLFFAHNFTDLAKIKMLIITFITFSLLASCIYIFNDITDIKYDRNHKKKKLRPVASGQVSVKQAGIIGIILLILSFSIQTIINVPVFHIYLIYLALNFFYGKFLKNIGIIDIITVAFFYIIRLWLGSVVSEVVLTPYIIIMTFLLALFLAISKRYDDLKYTEVRKVTNEYNSDFIRIAMTIFAAVIILCYIEYTILPETVEKFNYNYLYITSVFVLTGILRYLQLTFVSEEVYSPTEVCFKDRFMQLVLLGWIVAFYGIIYL